VSVRAFLCVPALECARVPLQTCVCSECPGVVSRAGVQHGVAVKTCGVKGGVVCQFEECSSNQVLCAQGVMMLTVAGALLCIARVSSLCPLLMFA